MAICSDSDDELSSALVLRIIYTDEGYSDSKLCDDVLIENNKYGCVIMQNNWMLFQCRMHLK